MRHPRLPALVVTLGLASASVIGAGCGSSGKPSESATLQAGLEAQVAGRLAQADADYLAVIKEDPRNSLAWYDLGVIAQAHQEAQVAQHDYLQSLAYNPHYIPAMYNLALIEAVVSPATGVKLFQQVVAAEPQFAAAHYDLGTLLTRQGETARGQAEIAAALKLDPSLTPPATTPRPASAG